MPAIISLPRFLTRGWYWDEFCFKIAGVKSLAFFAHAPDEFNASL